MNMHTVGKMQLPKRYTMCQLYSRFWRRWGVCTCWMEIIFGAMMDWWCLVVFANVELILRWEVSSHWNLKEEPSRPPKIYLEWKMLNMTLDNGSLSLGLWIDSIHPNSCEECWRMSPQEEGVLSVLAKLHHSNGCHPDIGIRISCRHWKVESRWWHFTLSAFHWDVEVDGGIWLSWHRHRSAHAGIALDTSKKRTTHFAHCWLLKEVSLH